MQPRWIVKMRIFGPVLPPWFCQRSKSAKSTPQPAAKFVLTTLTLEKAVKRIPCTIFLLREELLTIYGKTNTVFENPWRMSHSLTYFRMRHFEINSQTLCTLRDKRNSLKIVCFYSGDRAEKKAVTSWKAIVWNQKVRFLVLGGPRHLLKTRWLNTSWIHLRYTMRQNVTFAQNNWLIY